MFKKRHVKLSLGKDSDDAVPTDHSETISAISEVFSENAEMLAQYAIIGILAYISADTLRQVIVKSTPQR